jgi:cytochrome c553
VIEGSRRRGALLATALAVGSLVCASPGALAGEFDEALARVDRALVENPRHANAEALESCRARRGYAVELYRSGQDARALRSLEYCFHVLGVSKAAPEPEPATAAPSPQEIQARAAREVEEALALSPDLARGLEIYREDCAPCHTPEGRGLQNGSVPQIAGQHRKVVIKQLADIRAGNRDNLLMVPYSSVESMGGAQGIADVAGYIDTLEIGVDTKKGPGDDLELGARLYRENCARCHGATGEGNDDAFVPRIQAQHYGYLVRQFEWIRDGRRRNANPEMAAQIQGFGERETHAVLDYVSRLEPPPELQAPPGWHNPDFAQREEAGR